MNIKCVPIIFSDLTDGSCAYLVEVSLSGHYTIALIDTGATNSVIDEEYACTQGFMTKQRELIGHSASSSINKITYTELEIGIGGASFFQPIVTLSDFSQTKIFYQSKGFMMYNFILGMDVLYNLRATIDLDKLELRIPEFLNQ
jgi:hypothetical protein